MTGEQEEGEDKSNPNNLKRKGGKVMDKKELPSTSYLKQWPKHEAFVNRKKGLQIKLIMLISSCSMMPSNLKLNCKLLGKLIALSKSAQWLIGS